MSSDSVSDSDSDSGPIVVSTKRLARALDCQPRFVTQLEARGVLVKSGRGRWVLEENVARYVRHLRASQVGGNDDLAAAKLALTRAQHKRIEQSLAEREATAGEAEWQARLLEGIGVYMTVTLPSLASSCYAEFALKDEPKARELALVVQNESAGLAYQIKRKLRRAAKLARIAGKRITGFDELNEFIALGGDEKLQ